MNSEKRHSAIGKQEAREDALRIRRSMGSRTINSLSLEIQHRTLQMREFRQAKMIAIYVAKKDEVQTQGIILAALEQGKRVIVPRVDSSGRSLAFYEIRSLSDLSRGHFGVLEPAARGKPVELNRAQLVVVPVVAWSASGTRMGYGKGYFDRSLGSRGNAKAVGLAFETQKAGKLPSTDHDVPLDGIVTESRILWFGVD